MHKTEQASTLAHLYKTQIFRLIYPRHVSISRTIAYTVSYTVRTKIYDK